MRTILYDPPEIEYLDGHPHPKVSPKTAHSFVQGALIMILRTQGKGRGFAGPEWRFEPGQIDRTPTEFVPDVAWVSKERFRDVAEGSREKLPFSPDIAVEVRSPKDDLKYLREKIERYLATGSVLVLDVDPKTQTIEAHTRDGIRTFRRGEQFADPAAAWLKFDVDDVFSELDEYKSLWKR